MEQRVVSESGCVPNCPDFVAKDHWPPNLPDLYPLDYYVWGAMLEAYHKRQTKPKTIASLKEAFQLIWDNQPQRPIDEAVKELPYQSDRSL